MADGSIQQSLGVAKLLLAQTVTKHHLKNGLVISFQDNREESAFANNVIHYYSLKSNNLVSNVSMEFDFQIEELHSNSTTVFVYSKEKGRVFILE